MPVAQREWLARLLYTLPPRTLAALRMAIGHDAIYLLDPTGIEGVPLGIYYCEVAERIYVPAGLALVPAVASAVLLELVKRSRRRARVLRSGPRGAARDPVRVFRAGLAAGASRHHRSAGERRPARQHRVAAAALPLRRRTPLSAVGRPRERAARMSDASKIGARYEEVMATFLRPLLEGGDVLVGRPLTPGMLDHFSLARPSDGDVDRAIFDRMHGLASEIAPVRAIPWPDRGIAAVVMAAHDLVAITDPALDRAFARSARGRALEYVDWLVERAGPPETRGATLARHAIVSRTLELARTDVVVKNWAYTYRFFGRPVPPRVVAMPRVRMVRSTQNQVSVVDLFRKLPGELDAWSRIEALVARSPVTQLLRTDLSAKLVIGTAALAVLSDDIVRSGVARELVRAGSAVMSSYGEALSTLAANRAPPRLVFYLLALVVEAHLIAVLDARAGTEPVFGQPADPAAALFCAVLPAIVGAPDDLGALLELDPDDLAAVRARAGILDRQVPAASTALAVEIVDYAEPPALDHERDGPNLTEVHP